jgi:hypothetical protein
MRSLARLCSRMTFRFVFAATCALAMTASAAACKTDKLRWHLDGTVSRANKRLATKLQSVTAAMVADGGVYLERVARRMSARRGGPRDATAIHAERAAKSVGTVGRQQHRWLAKSAEPITYATTETSGTTPRGCPRAHARPHRTAANGGSERLGRRSTAVLLCCVRS